MKQTIQSSALLSLLGITLFLSSCTSRLNSPETKTISVFAGSACQPVLKEIARLYQEKRDIQVDLSFGSSGLVLSRMQLSKQGDVYMPGSLDFMLKAEEINLVEPHNVKTAAYLLPAINVKPGNPKKIRTLSDLTRPGLRIGIARPEQVCLGLYAVELLEANGLLKKILPNIVVTTESCAKTAAAIALGDLDAVIGWREFSAWEPRKIETVLLSNGEHVPRVGVIPLAVTTLAADPALAQTFVDFVVGPQGRTVFKEWGYLTDKTEILKLAPRAAIGGEYRLPPDWNSQ